MQAECLIVGVDNRSEFKVHETDALKNKKKLKFHINTKNNLCLYTRGITSVYLLWNKLREHTLI